MFKDWKWNVRWDLCFGTRGVRRKRRTPLSRSFDLRKMDIDQLSLLLAADHKGAAQDLQAAASAADPSSIG